MLLSEVRFLQGYSTIYDKAEFTLKEISLGTRHGDDSIASC
jgi:hypothetical protein